MNVKTASVCPVSSQVNGVKAVNGVNGEVKDCPAKGGLFREWRRPDLPSKCTYQPGAPLEKSPHLHVKPQDRPKIMPNILHNIGNSPLVRLNRIPQHDGLKCEFCKYEISLS
ncbi:cystathionine beta-synthase [Plakobranchus ocellatus]|uniref:Cystathionine beta-synthase n=1 Tax=Plakobranchus ocellatus TaxID=259542 RepID=A0AAV4CA16_9GAST|nr:cystathionine beta-synthase [Plakobranchus ocellatus]